MVLVDVEGNSELPVEQDPFFVQATKVKLPPPRPQYDLSDVTGKLLGRFYRLKGSEKNQKKFATRAKLGQRQSWFVPVDHLLIEN